MMQNFFNMMLTLLIGKFLLNDVPHAIFPDWFKERYKEYGVPPFILTGEEAEWPRLSTFYHITPAANVPLILKEGLKVPESYQETIFVPGEEPIPGVYLEEDRNFAVILAGMMHERKPGIKLSMLRVLVPNDKRFVYDPETLGAVIILDPLPPSLVSVEIPLITAEMVEEAKLR